MAPAPPLPDHHTIPGWGEERQTPDHIWGLGFQELLGTGASGLGLEFDALRCVKGRCVCVKGWNVQGSKDALGDAIDGSSRV